MSRALVLLTALLALAAGCVGPRGGPVADADEDSVPDAVEPASTAKAATDPPAPEEDARPGSLVVRAQMPDLTPLPDVNVTVGNVTAFTDAAGEARLGGLAPGSHVVKATKLGHRTAQAAALVRAGEEAFLEITLPATDGGQHAHERGVFAHFDVLTYEGHFDCSATYVIITGDCVAVIDGAFNRTGQSPPVPRPDPTTERHVIDFAVDVGWTALIVEMAWEEPELSTASGMTLGLEPSNASTDDHNVRYARVVGESPLRIEFRPGVPHATATAEDMPNPLGGEVLRARAFQMGHGHNAGDAGFLGVGAAKDFAFTLYVTVFYEGEPEDAYTAIPG